MPKYTENDIVIGRVVSEDENFILLEIAKDIHRKLHIEEGDSFFTLIFTAGKPWENQSNS